MDATAATDSRGRLDRAGLTFIRVPSTASLDLRSDGSRASGNIPRMNRSPLTLLAVAATSLLGAALFPAAPAQAATPKVCAQSDAARTDACQLVSALVSGAVAPGLTSTVSSVIATSTYRVSGPTTQRQTTWKGPVSKATINAVAQPPSRSVANATILDYSGSRYLIPTALFNHLASGQTSTAPSYSVDTSSSTIAANATSYRFVLEYVAKANKAGALSSQAYASFTVPLRKTFAVNAVGHYCPNYSTTNLMCRGGSRNANVTLKRTAVSSTASTLQLIWSPPNNTARKITVTMKYTIASSGDVHITTTTTG